MAINVAIAIATYMHDGCGIGDAPPIILLLMQL